MTWQEKGRKPGLNGPDKIDEKNMMKIGQLSAASGVGRSTIHHYLNLGLLPKPETAGLNVHLYGPVHLAILREIKRLREEPGMSLAEIKIWVDRQDPEVLAEKAADGAFVLPAAEETGSEVRKTGGVKREQIVETATELFSRLGYEAVRISDITDALRMSKATFYEYFQGKEQLFIECIERLTVDIVPREGWQSIREERDYFKRQRLRARQFLESFPGYSGILQQARLFSPDRQSGNGGQGQGDLPYHDPPHEKGSDQGAGAGRDPSLRSGNRGPYAAGPGRGSGLENDGGP